MVEDTHTKSEITEEVKADDQAEVASANAEISPIEESKRILEETKKERAIIIEERKRIEKATAEMLVGGRTLAGQRIPQHVETPREYAERMLKGEPKK